MGENVAESIEEPVEVTQTRDNVLKLFSNTNSQWSEYYNITMATNEAEERRKNATPLMSVELKQKLLERRAARRSGGNVQLDSQKSEPVEAVAESAEHIIAAPDTPVPESTPFVSEEEKQFKKRNKDTIKMDSVEQVDESDENENDSWDHEAAFIDFDSDDEALNGIAEDSSRFISRIPWQTKSYEGHPGIMLHEELIDFYNFVKETPEEREQRAQLIAKITDLCKKVDRTCTVKAFGSYAVDLMLPGSDLDLYVHSPKYIRNHPVAYLRQLTDELRKTRFARKIEFVQFARVPIVKFVDADSGQHVDIACNMQGPTGEGAIAIINEFSEQYPAFKYLVIFLKYFVRQRALNEVYTGGVSSYGLSLMVISHLQMHLSNITEKDKRTTSLGTLLLDFFGLYGVYFNYKKVGIDVTDLGSYVPADINYDPPNKGTYKGIDGTSLMTIDPNDETNNVTKNCWNFAGVKNAFKYAFSALTSLKNYQQDGSYLCSIIRVTQDLIERRVWIHGDEQYRLYCARNMISYGQSDENHHQPRKDKRQKRKDNKAMEKAAKDLQKMTDATIRLEMMAGRKLKHQKAKEARKRKEREPDKAAKRKRYEDDDDYDERPLKRLR